MKWEGLPRSTCLTTRTESTKLEYRDNNIQYYWYHIVPKLCLNHLFNFKRNLTSTVSQLNFELENWHSQRGPRLRHVTMTLTFDLLTPKSIGVFLSLSSICVWSMKSPGQTLFELSRYNEVWRDGQTDRQTDRRTDGRTDGRTDKVITIGLPHLRWQGPMAGPLKIPLSVTFFMCLLTAGWRGQLCYIRGLWLLSNQCCQGTKKITT